MHRHPPRAYLLASLCLALPLFGACSERPAGATSTAATTETQVATAEPAAQDEQAVREAVSEAAMLSLLNENYAELERQATEYRNPAARTPSGQWKQAYLYAGLVMAFAAIPAEDDENWGVMDRRLQAWAQLSPTSPTARLARAEAHITRAWAYRGACGGCTVDAAAWAPFRDHLEQARLLLEQDKAVAAVDPHWYHLMSNVALGQEWDGERLAKLEADTLTHAAGYYDAVFAIGNHYLPQWGGSWAQVDAYARRVVERTRADEGAGMYARLYWSVSGSSEGTRLPEGHTADLALLKQGMDDVLARYPDAWNRNHFAAMACSAQDPAAIAALMPGIDTPILAAWGSMDQFESCRDWAADFAP